MSTLADGLVIIINGALSVVGHLVSWNVLVGAAIAASLAWMARLEMDQADRSAIKPHVGRH